MPASASPPASSRRPSVSKSVYLLTIGFAVMVLSTVLVGGYGLTRVDALYKEAETRKAAFTAKRELINTMQTASRERAIALTLMVNMLDPFERDEEYLRFLKLGALFANAREQYLALQTNNRERAIFEHQGIAAGLASEAHEKLFAYITDENLEMAEHVLTTESIPRQQAVFTAVSDLQQLLSENEALADKEMAARYRSTYSTAVLLFLGSIVIVGGGIVVFLVDRITGYERALSDEKDRFTRATEGASDGIWDWNLTTNEMYLSPQWERILGYHAGELPHHSDTWLERVHPDDKEQVTAAIDAHISNRESVLDTEHRLRNRNGDWIWCHARGRAATDHDGKTRRMAGSLADISRRKKIEEETQRADRRLRRQQEALLKFSDIDCRRSGELTMALQEVTPHCTGTMEIDRVVIWFLDIQNDLLIATDMYDQRTGVHEEGELLELNDLPEFAAAIKQYPTISADLAHWHPATKSLSESYLDVYGIQSLIISTIRSGPEILGYLFFEQCSRTPREWASDEISFASSISDMVARAVESCRRHKAEDQLQEANARLEERVELRTHELAEKNQALDAALEHANAASRSKSEFLANMSHEIRTPMNGVLGMLDVLKHSDLTPHQTDLANTAYSSGETLLHLLNDILDLSKIEAGKLELEHTDFDLRDKLESVVSLMAQPAHVKGVEITAVMPPAVPAWVNGDPTRLRQILTNLTGNAIKFTHSGEIIVTVELEKEHGDALWMKFTVRDTGIGIAHDQLEHIFETFSQADGSTTRKYGGSGLGLAISRHLSELMGGTLGVESTPGEGSTFWFRICLHKALSPAPEGLRGELLHGKHALIVDDNVTNCQVLEHCLDSWDVSHVAVTDPRQALQRLEQGEEYDVVLLDMMMPGMSGETLARMIRANSELAQPKLVLLTSVTLSSCKAAIKAGLLDACISKPVRQSTLYNTLISSLSITTPTQKPDTEPEPLQNKERLLVVDDHPVNQKVACGMLAHMGYTVATAANGQEAIDALKKQRYDLVFMDCQMPVMDGYEATQAIRAMGETTPIIAMTANAMQGDRERCIAAGMDDYVSKPLKQDTMKDILEQWLEHS